MNELSQRWDFNAAWGRMFEESDRLVVESLVRAASDVDGNILPLSIADDDLLTGLLLVARSVRLEHVALDLTLDALTRTLGDAGLRATPESAARIVAALIARERPLGRFLIELDDVGTPVAERGAAIVVALDAGRPAFAYLRRLAACESRTALSLWDAAINECSGDALGPLVDTRGVVAHSLDDAARHVAENLVSRRVSIVTGGPGTGKTTAIAAMLVAVARANHDAHAVRAVRVALCAPTAKAAVRLHEAVSQLLALEFPDLDSVARLVSFDDHSGSVHRLLGLRPGRVHSDVALNADVIIVDEVSMLELPLLDQLLSRASTSTRVVLVGDPHQLASVNVGAALADIVAAAESGPLAALVTHLSVNHRSSPIVTKLARAINDGDLDALLAALHENPDQLTLHVERDAALRDVLQHAERLRNDARVSDDESVLAELSRQVVLCATRRGEGSLAWWTVRLAPEARAGEFTGALAVGTPVLVTRNEPADDRASTTRLANGDLGIIVERDGELRALFGPANSTRERRLHQLPEIERAWAMTIHKSQGSEYDNVIVSLPNFASPLLTRELLYTAVTRARSRVTILASEATLRLTLARRVDRVSGLAARVAALSRSATDVLA